MFLFMSYTKRPAASDVCLCVCVAVPLLIWSVVGQIAKIKGCRVVGGWGAGVILIAVICSLYVHVFVISSACLRDLLLVLMVVNQSSVKRIESLNANLASNSLNNYFINIRFA